ncbi:MULTISPECIES: AIPR family protein [Nostoc]|uniref:AIPR family protein n=1 Tax=Nostoc paludosum FACHB-159 TaxID=2692908 RepID=A0ABR8K162_9NOSO|nr:MULTISPECIES: AIPR family protein [Nostoc]MBD2676945.1 AIPR family protein [Nostoc sp. FACHB-857]MBD2733144.1 AIPR family protein [Nostoc paludosum FACHB-159]
MPTNDSIVLDTILEQKKSQIADCLRDDEYFEIFTFEQILKKYDLSYEELISGKIGAGDDGGIDGFFTFINGEILDKDTNLKNFKRYPLIELFLIQSKRSPSFSETAVEHVIRSAMNIFNLDNDLSILKKTYNSELIDAISSFRETYLELISIHPSLKIIYIYASKGETQNIHKKVYHSADNLKETILNCFRGATVNIQFIGARELIDASRLEKNYNLKLKFIENYISRSEDNYIVLATLKDYYEFVTDENNELRQYIFTFNVRDYQGNVEVNKDIQKTLESDNELDFWWLNNGITVLSSKATVAGKIISLDDVQIVNGLQTTNTIYKYLKNHSNDNEKDKNRAILVRIIATNDTESINRIIKATNFQTPIPPASLKATDPIQSDIENYFLSKGWYYDRRKNYYKNMGKPIDRIISIPYLAQAVMAIVLREPNISRSRPSSIIKTDSDYKRVFKEKSNLELYMFCVKMMKQVELFIRSTVAEKSKQDDYTFWKHTSPLQILSFHLAMLLVVKLLSKNDYNPTDVEKLLQVELKQEIISQTLFELIQLIDGYVNSRPSLSINTIVKQKEFVTYLLENVNLSSIE